jgi:cytochrome c553
MLVSIRVPVYLVAVALLAGGCAKQSATSNVVVTGDPKAGAALVQTSNCAGCHGGRMQGDLGPNLIGIEKRRTPVQIAGAITNPEAPMPKFAFSAQQVGDLVAYLSQLDAGGDEPKISVSPEVPRDSAIVSVRFPGTPPSDAMLEASMKMGHSSHGPPPMRLKKTSDPHVLSARVPFSMGGAWMLKVRYDKSREVDMPINVGE